MRGIVRMRPGLSRGFRRANGVMVAGGGSGSQGLRAARSRKVSVKTVVKEKPEGAVKRTGRL